MSSNSGRAADLSVSGQPVSFRTMVGHRCTVWRNGYAEFELDLQDHHYNPGGIVHGGVYLTVLDSTLAHAAVWCAVPGNKRRAVTISLTTSFLAPARGGLIRAIGRLEGVCDRIATCSGEVVDGDGRLVAAAQGSFRYFPGSEHLDGLPQKEKPAAGGMAAG